MARCPEGDGALCGRKAPASACPLMVHMEAGQGMLRVQFMGQPGHAAPLAGQFLTDEIADVFYIATPLA